MLASLKDGLLARTCFHEGWKVEGIKRKQQAGLHFILGSSEDGADNCVVATAEPLVPGVKTVFKKSRRLKTINIITVFPILLHFCLWNLVTGLHSTRGWGWDGVVAQHWADGRRSRLQGTAANVNAGLWRCGMDLSLGYSRVSTSWAWGTGLFTPRERYCQKPLW